jgi:Asp-tRNA(Asn)/Glu-tRNA(Gln) amidotransferase A subunit family amidase
MLSSRGVAVEPTVTEWRGRLDAGEVSARELATHYLGRLDEVAHLNAVAARDDEAVLRAADAADVRLRAGERAPLLGVPVTVKDMLDVAGLPCRAGSLARTEVPASDAVLVQRIRAAGGIVLAKTTMPELGLSYETDSPATGRTVHPLDAERTPGGSSGGEGALLGADASAIGVGTDGGGSIRVPSAYCGLFGLRPTPGRVPLTGAWPPGRAGSMFDLVNAGPMGRATADVATLLDVMAGADHGDVFSHPVPLSSHDDVDVTALRVGWYVEDGTVSADPVITAGVRSAVAALADAGATVEQTAPPTSVAGATELFFRATAADGGEGLRALVDDDPTHHTEQFLRLLDHPPYGSSTSAADYFAVQEAMLELRTDVRRWVDGYDVVIAPVCAGQAPLHETPPGGISQERYLRYEAFNFTHAYSVAGLPAGSAPVALVDGLPVGVQVIAASWREDRVLAAMDVLERAFGGFHLVSPG